MHPVRFWLGAVLLAPALAMLPDITRLTFQAYLYPKPYQIYQVRAGWGGRCT